MQHACEKGVTWTRFWWGRPQEGDHLEVRGVDGRRGFECMLWRLAEGGAEWIHLAQDRPVAGCCECDDELLGSGTS
jgi:hypothetical protein